MDKRFKSNTCTRCTTPCRNELCSKCVVEVRKEKGQCIRCSQPVHNGTKLCLPHLEYQRESCKRNYDPDKKRKYYEDNKQDILQAHKVYERKRRANNDVKYILSTRLRARLNDALSSLKQGKKKHSMTEALGCSLDELKTHIENQFYDNPVTGEAMTWENYGLHGWHLDHIYPLSMFNLQDRTHFRLANSYQNLQPMWALDNIRKANKLVDHIIWLDGEPYIIERVRRDP